MENKELQSYDYYAEFKFGESEFREFSQVSYRQFLRMSIYILLLYIGFCLYYVLLYGFLPTNPVFHIAYLAFTVIVYLVNSTRIKDAARKEAARWEKPFKDYLVTFGENIAVRRDGTEKVYPYNDIKKICATENLYCIYLRQKTYLIIKRPLSCSCAITDFPTYLMTRCEKLRSPKVLKLQKLKKANKMVFIVTTILIAACLLFVALPVTIIFASL